MGKLTENIPKPMLEIKGKPILAHKIESLPKEIDEVVLVVGYLKEKIMEYFGNEYNDKKIIYIEQKHLNGTGGALYLAKDVLKNRFLIMMGDDLYTKKDIEKSIQKELSILGYRVEDPRQFGMIEKDDNGRLVNIIEKPDILKPSVICTGLYVLNEKIFDYPIEVSPVGEIWLVDGIAKMAKDFDIWVVETNDWFPIGNPEDLEKAQGVIDKFI